MKTSDFNSASRSGETFKFHLVNENPEVQHISDVKQVHLNST